MRTLTKSTVFPAGQETIFLKLKEFSTLQKIAWPYAAFKPVDQNNRAIWQKGSTFRYKFRLFGVIPLGVHTIYIEKFDMDGISSKEGNAYVPVWNHEILLDPLDSTHTRYTDRVSIDAGWKTDLVYIWACAFYTHRQKRWIQILEGRSQ
ncbi:MAG: hypothetical protein J6E46_09355 [Faecalicoccus sp.]|nr:hypothetical protein [Faecalicoccus sp.]